MLRRRTNADWCNVATLAVFDLDGTLTRGDTFRLFVPWYLARRPWRLARCGRLPLDATLYETGLRDNAWLKARVLGSIFGGAREASVGAMADAFVARVMESAMRPGALAALGAHQRAGDRTVMLSANFDFLVQRFAAGLGIEQSLSTVAERDAGGRFTGRLASVNCYGPEKCHRIEEWLGAARAGTHVVVYADHHSDLPLMRWADRAVLVNPTPWTRHAARGMPVEVVAW
ncbi:MAG TPA: HAD-IB family hydrolase [Stellaceae bacterium]|nr:HAD-IB family hydrolase [Stellaceae bacterium]